MSNLANREDGGAAQPASAPAAPKVGLQQIAVVVLLGVGFLGMTRHWSAAVVMLTAIVVMFDASFAGMRKDPDRKGILNMDPLGWGLATVILFIVAWPLYIVARAKEVEKRGNPILFAVVCVFGAVVMLSSVLGVVALLRGHTPIQASVNCKTSPRAIACDVKQVQGDKPGRVCWTVVLPCTSGGEAKASTCAESAPHKTVQHLIPEAEVQGLQDCGKLTGMKVLMDKIEER